MSNYLNNLVARTLKQAPVVQPRLASIFEPLPTAVDNGVSSVRNVDSEIFASSDASPVISRAEALAPRVDPMNAEVDLLPRHRMDEHVESRTGDQVIQPRPAESRHFHPTVTPIAPRVDERNDVGPNFATRASTVLKGLRADSNETKAAMADSSQSVRGEIESSNNAPSRWPPRRQLDSEVEDQVFVPKSIDRDGVHSPAIQQTSGPETSLSFLRPNALPVVPVRSETRESATPDQVQPTIKVTIGRVDVRAVFTQASPPRASHAKPTAAMSLNDYLKQRNEGRR